MKFARQLFNAAALVGLGAAGVLGYAYRFAPMRIQITRETFWHRNIPREFHGYKIAQFSDIHLDGTARSLLRLAEAVDRINAEQPDLIVFTGDFVTLRYHTQVDDLRTHFARLRAPDGVLTILGNHDHRQNRLLTLRALQEAGVTDLNNRVVTLQRGEGVLHIAGVDSVSRQRARLDQVLAALPPTGMALLLAHEPDFADIAAAMDRFTLQLSGHTHGGQIDIPLLVEGVLPDYGRRYKRGIYNVRGMWLYVNRGIGTTGLPLRWRSAPEITVLTLGFLHL